MGTLSTLAEQAIQFFRFGDEAKGERKIWMLQDDTPQWVRDLVYAAHDNFMPDDHKYEFIVDALESIRCSDVDDDLMEEVDNDLEVDIYNHDLLKWVGSNINRSAYVDDVLADGHASEFFQLLREAQFRERREVLGFVIQGLRERVNDMDEELTTTE